MDNDRRRRALRLRRQTQVGRRLYDPNNPMEALTECEFYSRFRLCKDIVAAIAPELVVELLRECGRGLTPLLQLLIALRYYVTGAYQMMVSDTMNVSEASVSRSVSRVSSAIRARLSPRYIIFPTAEQRRHHKQKFCLS